MFVATKYFGRDKSMLVATNCHDKTFIVTNITLSRQKTYFVVTKDMFCGDKHVLVDDDELMLNVLRCHLTY